MWSIFTPSRVGYANMGLKYGFQIRAIHPKSKIYDFVSRKSRIQYGNMGVKSLSAA